LPRTTHVPATLQAFQQMIGSYPLMIRILIIPCAHQSGQRKIS
jgi:hypothetical protein